MTAQPPSTKTNKTIWQRFLSRRHNTAQPSPIILNRRQIFILPTQAGLMFALVLFIMLLTAINYNNSMSYALTFLLGSMAMVSILHTYRQLLGLYIEAGKVVPVFAGETAQFQLWLDNRGKAARYALVWQRRRGESLFTLNLGANQRVNITIPVSTLQRGQIFLERLTVYSRFPLGVHFLSEE